MTLAQPRLARIEATERRVDSLAHLALAGFFGFVIASAYYHVPVLKRKTAELEHVEKKVIPSLKHQAVAAKASAELANARLAVEHKDLVVEHKKAETAKAEEIAMVRVLVSQGSDPPPIPKPKP